MSTTQSVLDELDDETLNLIIALQLDDAACVERENNDGDLKPSDNTTACRLFADELRQFQTVRRYEEEGTKLAEAMAAAASAPSPNITCVSCEDQFPPDQAFQAPCTHNYCGGCLGHLHRAAMIDEALYPPRCCNRPMPWDGVRPMVDASLAAEFDGKKEELDLPAAQRTYCSSSTCSKFLGTTHIANGVATCSACNKATCTMCKSARHDGDCPEDEAMQQTLKLAEEEGWRRCNRCKAMIELQFGCYHMTCTCHHQFCYLCGADWKTCQCAQWDDERLEARAEQIVDRQPAGGAADQRARQVAQEAQRLRDRHNCTHRHWTHVRGAGQCEECMFNLPVFTMICDQCRLRACRRCMQNRL